MEQHNARRAFLTKAVSLTFPDQGSGYQCLSKTQLTQASIQNHANDPNEERQQGLALQDEKVEIKPPPMWRVLIMNDDYTPMEFVVAVLQMFFSMDHDRAYRVMMHVHTRGKGICGVYTKDIAETKVAQVNHFARSHQHPLMCAMEEV